MQPQLIPDCWKVVAENCFVVDLLALSVASKEINKYTADVVSMRRFKFKKIQRKIIKDVCQRGNLRSESWWEVWMNCVTKYGLLSILNNIKRWCNDWCSDDKKSFIYNRLLDNKLYITDEEYYFRTYGIDINR